MKNVLTNAKCEARQGSVLRYKMFGLAMIAVGLFTMLGVHPVMAQASTSYTISVGEQLSGKTTVTLPFKKGYNLDEFTITAPETAVITQAESGTVINVVNGKASGKVPTGTTESDGRKGQIVFDLSKDGTLPLTPGEHRFTITMLSAEEKCSSVEVEFIVHVLDKPVLTLMENSVVCQGGTNNVSVDGKITAGVTATLTYDWKSDHAESTTSDEKELVDLGQTSGNGLNFASGTDELKQLLQATVSNTNVNPVGVVYTVTPTATYTINGKQIIVKGEAKSVTVTVNPKVLIDLSPVSQTICNNTQTAITISTTNTGGTSTYAWTVNPAEDITGAATGTGTSIAQTLENGGTAPADVTYTVTHTYTNTVACTVQADVIVTVMPSVNLTVTPVKQIVCAAGDEASATFATTNSGDGATSVYSWALQEALPAGVTQEAGDGVTAEGLTFTGADFKMKLTNTTTAAVALTYTVTHTFTKNGQSCDEQAEIIIYVNPQLDIVFTPEENSICSGGTSDIGVSTLNTGGVSGFAWVEKTKGAHITVESGELSGTKIAMTLKNSGTIPETIVYTVTQTFTHTEGGTSCTQAEEVTITVLPDFAISAITNPSDICSLEGVETVEFSTTPEVTPTDEVVYTWEFSFNPAELEVEGAAEIDTTNPEEHVAKGNGTKFSLTKVNLKDHSPKTVQVTVKATYQGVCEQTTTFDFTVNPKPTFELGE